MAATPSFLARTPIDVPNKSGFSLPHEVTFTGRCGTLYPIMMKRCIPGETHSLRMFMEAELPPMVSNFFGRVDLVFEAFFVPMNLLWKGWEQFSMHPTSNSVYPAGTPTALKPRKIPGIVINSFSDHGPGSLSDFLGVKVSPEFDENVGAGDGYNSLRWLAYARIYDDWYRNTMVQAPLFAEPALGDGPSSAVGVLPAAATLPYISGVISEDGDTLTMYEASSPLQNQNSYRLADGSTLLDLRQRNWNLDYFTAATPEPQAGSAATITFDVSVDNLTGDGAGEISVSAIRSANAIQQWMERNNIVGYDYADQIFAQYGVYPDNRMLRKPIYLGRYIETVYNRSVFQTVPTSDESLGSSNKNPFAVDGSGVGTKSGSSAANGRNTLFTNFRSTDHGYLVVIASMRPVANYSTGLDRDLLARRIGDIPFPLLSGVGNQAIYSYELTGDIDDTDVFGYIDQYAHHKTAQDEVHGLLKDGSPLSAFQLQRSFDPGVVQISSSFLQIPQNYLDQVKQVTSDVVPVDYWCSVFFDYNKLSPLPVFSVPTLGEIKNTHKESVRRGGSRL